MKEVTDEDEEQVRYIEKWHENKKKKRQKSLIWSLWDKINNNN